MITRPGFSLIELVVIVMVIATMCAIALPRLGDGQSQYRLDLTTRQITQDIEHSREAARFESVAKSLTFDPVVASYFLWSGLPQDVDVIHQDADVAEVDAEPFVGLGGGMLSTNTSTAKIQRHVRSSPAIRQVYTDQNVLVATQVLLGDAPFRAQLLTVNLAEKQTLSFTGHGVAIQGGSVTIGVGNRSSELIVDYISGAVTTTQLSLAATNQLLASHSGMLLSNTGRSIDDLLGIGSSVVETVNTYK